MTGRIIKDHPAIDPKKSSLVQDLADEMLKEKPHRVCPKCKHLWVQEATYCGYDGTRLGGVLCQEM